jgi:hypothetical protein
VGVAGVANPWGRKKDDSAHIRRDDLRNRMRPKDESVPVWEEFCMWLEDRGGYEEEFVSFLRERGTDVRP